MRANEDEPIDRLRIGSNSNKRDHRKLLAALVFSGLLKSGNDQVRATNDVLSVPGIMVQRETRDAYTNPRIYSTVGYLERATSQNIGVDFETVRSTYDVVGSTAQLMDVLPVQTLARLYQSFDTTSPAVQEMLANNRYFYLPTPPPNRAKYIRGDNGYDTVIISSNALSFGSLVRERHEVASVGRNVLTSSDSLLVDDLRHELLHDAWHHLLSSQDKEKFINIMDQLFELEPQCDTQGRPLVLAYYLHNPNVAASHVGLPSGGVVLSDSCWQSTYRRGVELVFNDVVSEFARNYSPQDATVRQHVTDLLLWYTRFRINMEQRFVTYPHLNRGAFMREESYACIESDGEDIVPFRRFYQGILNPRDLPTESKDRALTTPHEFDGPNPYMGSEDDFVRNSIPVIRQFISFLGENKARFHIQ